MLGHESFWICLCRVSCVGSSSVFRQRCWSCLCDDTHTPSRGSKTVSIAWPSASSTRSLDDPSAASVASTPQTSPSDVPNNEHAARGSPANDSSPFTAGTGSAKTLTHQNPDALQVNASDSSKIAINPLASTTGGGGAANSEKIDPTTSGLTGMSAGSSAVQPRIDPWQSARWPGDASNATQAARDRHLPDSYRELISSYFSPE